MLRMQSPSPWFRALPLRAALCACVLLAGCAAPVRDAAPAATPVVVAPPVAPATCVPPEGPLARPDFCTLPPDVRAFVQDRDGCDHFRGEPWPESDDAEARERRQYILQNVRSLCAGTDRELEALLQRHRDDAASMKVLSEFERNIEGTR